MDSLRHLTLHHLAWLLPLLAWTATVADVPRTVQYQGKLRTNTGAAATGPVSLEVTLYGHPTSGAPILFGPESHVGVPLTNGLFGIQIGSNTVGGIPDSALISASVFLGVSVNGQAELSPRTALQSTPFALKVKSAEQLVRAATNEARVVVDALGNVGVGTAAPLSTLDVSSTDGGLLVPRLTTTQRDAISSPPEGLLVYNTTTGCFNFRKSGVWTAVCGDGGSPLTGGVIAADQSICSGGTPAGLTSTSPASGGSGAITYQWATKPTGGVWSDIAGATSSTYSPGALSATTQYRRVAEDSNNAAHSNAVTITAAAALNGGTIAADQTICSGSPPAMLTSTAAASGGTGTTTYQWEFQPQSGSWGDVPSGGNSESYSPPSLTTTTSYRRKATNNCGSAYSNTLLITVLVGPSSQPSLSTAYNGNMGYRDTNSPPAGATRRIEYSTNAGSSWNDPYGGGAPACDANIFGGYCGNPNVRIRGRYVNSCGGGPYTTFTPTCSGSNCP